MSGIRKQPQARDRAIGAQLKSIRAQRTGLSLEQAAELLGWSPATMSRIENGRRHISAEDVASILAVYRVPAAQRDAIVRVPSPSTNRLVVPPVARRARRVECPGKLRSRRQCTHRLVNPQINPREWKSRF
ncbi:helix-turn-helix domain-containing protein [Kibdelosporangium phytohabitans]|uniref:helix-turn-helix domain-containing protein n=1 Tax=Kibdelosporangium phytohabitans TaxID=860235 RepID=UPI0009FAA78C